MGQEAEQSLGEQFEARRLRMLARADPGPVLWLAFGVLLFNLWDRWLDASVAQSNLWLRLFAASLLVLAWLLLRQPAWAARFGVPTYAFVFVVGEWTIALAVLRLPNGFELGMPSLLLFPLALAFYPLATWRYLLINALGAGGIVGMLWWLQADAEQALNFILLYGLSLWVGAIALRVHKNQHLRLFRLERRHAQSARTDLLTGLANRRSLEELGIERMRGAQKGLRPLCVLLFDLDHFKAVNDQYGHDVGDLALTHAGRLLARELRGDHLLGRWGGEEFLGVLDNTPLVAAGELASRCVARLASSPLALPEGGSLSLGTSVGVAQMQPGEPLDALVKRADAALYRAKQAGRGTFRMDTPDTTTAPGGAAA